MSYAHLMELIQSRQPIEPSLAIRQTIQIAHSEQFVMSWVFASLPLSLVVHRVVFSQLAFCLHTQTIRVFAEQLCQTQLFVSF